MKIQHLFFRTSFLLIVLSLFSSRLVAQSDQSNPRFTEGDINDSGILSFGVPLGNYKGRGINLPVSLSYSSDVWKVEHIGRVQTTIPGYSCCVTQSVTEGIFSKFSTSGWKSSLQLPIIEFPKSNSKYDYQGKSYDYAPEGCFGYRVREVYIHMPDGSTHTLRKTDQPSNSPAGVDMQGTFYAIDGSRMRFDANGTADTGTIYMPDGTYYVLGHPISYIYDRNGNYISYDQTYRRWTDTLGRQIINPLPAIATVGDFNYSLPGLSGPLQYTFKWRLLENALTPDSGGNPPPLKVVGSEALPNPFLPPSSTNYPAAQTTNAGRLFQSTPYAYGENGPLVSGLIVGKGQSAGQLFDPVVLSEVVLPDGRSYRFSYNVYGEIDKIIYPTNAYDRYEYSGYPPDPSPPEHNEDMVEDQQPYLQSLRWISKRQQSVDGTENDIHEWTYLNEPYLDGGGNLSIIAPDNTRTEIVKYNAGPKVAATTGQGGQTIVWVYPFGFKDSRVGMVKTRKFFSTSTNGLGGSMLRQEVYDYDQTTQNYSISCTANGINHYGTFALSRAPRLMRMTNIILEGEGSALAQSNTYGYDLSNQFTTGIDQTSAVTYSYVAVDHETALSGDLTLIPVGNPAKTTETSYSSDVDYQSANILGLPTSVQIKDASNNVVSRSEMSYDNINYVPAGTKHGLPTTTRTWDSTKGTNPLNQSFHLITHATFDQWGNRTIATDAKGYTTTTTYDSTYHAYPISVTTAVPDDSGTHASNAPFTSYTSYDTTTGLVLSATDINGQTNTMEYVDPLLRPTKVTAPNGAQTVTEYGAGTSEATRWVKVSTQIDADHWSEAKSFYDGLGRTYKTQKTDTVDSEGDIYTLTCYDNMGRVTKTSNPFRDLTTQTCSSSSLEWTVPEYDDLSRTIKVTSPDPTSTPTTVQVTYGLSTDAPVGTTQLVTDQAGRTRKGITDALRNMVRVIEDPTGTPLLTDYVFDTLGNLRKTTQGDQIRYFNYDSLGRLLRAKQVEQTVNSNLALTTADPITGNNSWTVGYTYDDNSNIISTTDAKNVTITATYDRLNRLITRDYSDSTPDVEFFYDGRGIGGVPALSNGKTTRVFSSVSDSRNTSFDEMGHTLTSRQITDGRTYDFGYSYNLSGALIEETYPSGRVVRNTLDQNGQLEEVQSRKNANQGYWAYANNFTYNAAGAVTKLQLGNGHWETAAYNERQQVTMIGLGTTDNIDSRNLLALDFEYVGPTSDISDHNNGSMRKQTISVPAVGSNPAFTAVQSYTYDNLNRIHDAAETVSGNQTWKQTFSYDRYGNRSFDANNTTTIPQGCSTAVCNPGINLANDNRFNGGQGYSYDENGAVTQNAASERFGYDAESRQKEFFAANNGGSTPDATYQYDGLANRIKKVTATETVIFVYDAGGQLSAEYSTLDPNQSEGNSNPQVAYITADHLGSPRITTNASGAVLSRKDFTAFGENVSWGPRTSGTYGNGYDSPVIRQDYTGYQKDLESNLEYSQARYYNPAHGRFTSVDPLPASATIRNPQSFNRYSYVLNSPYKFTDPLGLMAGGCGADRARCDGDPGTGSAHLDEGLADHEGNLQQTYRALELQRQAQDASNRGDYDAMWGIIDSSGGLIDAELATGTVTAEATLGNPTVILAVGEPGKGDHNQGSNLLRAAYTRSKALAEQGVSGTIRMVKDIQGFQAALDAATQTIYTVFGIEVFTHGSSDEIHLGQEAGESTNISRYNVGRLSNRSETLQYITLYACYTGRFDRGIAFRLGDQLNVVVNAFTDATIFSNKPDLITTRGKLPDTGPAYLIADGGYMRTFPKPRP